MTHPQPGTRREFLRRSAVASAALASTSAAIAPQAVHAAGSDELRVGLVGCGGRGTGAARQALEADKNVKLIAMADVFEDRLQTSLKALQNIESVSTKIDVPRERQFVGFNAYQQLLNGDVDVVLLATPPHFRPMHLKAAIEAGVHVFAEKPVAVDAPGVRSVLETCAKAKQKNLSVVSGLCLRYSYGFQEVVRRIHEGAIGEIHTLQANDYRGPIWVKPRQEDWTDMHWQMRNWYYFTWLSGDFNVEQHVHYLDVCAWAMKGEYPESALGMGGREVRKGEEFGNIFDHHGVVYRFASGATLFSNTRQMRGCKTEMSASVTGSQGRAQLSERRNGLRIQSASDEDWVYRDKSNDVYQTEHDELFAGIRSGKVLNNGEYMAKSTMLAIMGRMATYTGQLVTWKQAMESTEDLSPKEYAWGPLATPPVAVPGVTRLV